MRYPPMTVAAPVASPAEALAERELFLEECLESLGDELQELRAQRQLPTRSYALTRATISGWMYTGSLRLVVRATSLMSATQRGVEEQVPVVEDLVRQSVWSRLRAVRRPVLGHVGIAGQHVGDRSRRTHRTHQQ